MAEAILGTVGTTWPWKSSVQWNEDVTLIDQALRDVIMTSLGERKMNYGYGSSTIATVFENKGELLHALARREINLAVSTNLPAVKITDIIIDEGENDTDPVTITVEYEYQGAKSAVTSQVARL